MSVFLGLLVVSETLEVSSLFGSDWLGAPLAVPPGWCSLLIALPMTKVLDHPKRVAVIGQVADTLKIGDIVNRLMRYKVSEGSGSNWTVCYDTEEIASICSLSKFSVMTMTTSSPQRNLIMWWRVEGKT